MEKVANETAYFKLDRHIWSILTLDKFCYIFPEVIKAHEEDKNQQWIQSTNMFCVNPKPQILGALELHCLQKLLKHISESAVALGDMFFQQRICSLQ